MKQDQIILVEESSIEVTLPRLSPARDYLYFVEPGADCKSTKILRLSLDAAAVPGVYRAGRSK